MRRTNLDFEHSRWGGLIRLAMVAVILTAYLPASSMAQEEGQKTFSSAEDASLALVTAIQNNDERAMLDVLGQDAKQKDLGNKTDVLAKAMKKYNPDSSWQKAEVQQEETAGEREK